ncbi:hypothetical protein D0Z00_002448 [Geotrichum galactomycetum]|uniref:Uncharacterized protein n=1 Tax=Geotrichum galactomycetum TaxID=27317 RepID=A0ACB6V474_9ASCO|nr:hypothetical protein D0Z00_002448 [Geotrichum candidum]
MGYKNKQREEVPPHIYAISDLAFRNMLEEHENQSILVTGESGAGKTENTKKVIQYLAAITSSKSSAITRNIIKSPVLGSEQNQFTFEQQILQANPILEAFGNAQTVRNNNSSRFGKFIRIEFGKSGQIAGASIDWYLLEKSRVIYQNPKERNYHIFYQLVKALPKDLKTSLILESDPNLYAYLKDSNKVIDGVDDSKEFRDLVNSFKIMGFTSQEQTEIFRVMSAILNIGNIELGSERSDQARILNVTQAERVCHLLGINSEQFVKGLLRPRVKAGREWVHQSRSAVQVKNSLEALAKSLYERTFGAIVDRINQTLEKGNDNTSFIGVLDIAGFEIFEHNSFEQLCINYTNEKLQQFFNHHMFVLEQEEYSRENIEWKYIDFGHDLQPTIDLIEKPNRYEVLVSGMPSGYIEGQKACQMILKKLRLDDNLYKVGLTKLFFKSGVLAELEERREAMVRELITQFQSIARGHIQRQRVRKTLFKAEATSIIKRNFELYLDMKDNPWWKLYVKMRPLLIVSRESGTSKAQDMMIKKLEKTVKVIEQERNSVKDEHKRVELQLKSLEETLDSERRLALDKEEILKRSQQREDDLEDQLAGALEDLDDLELQCEELLIAKKRVDSQAETLRSELDKGAVIIGHLEEERVKLKNKLAILEEETARNTSNQAAKLEEIEKLQDELTKLKHELSNRNSLINELEEKALQSDGEVQSKLDSVTSRMLELTIENREQKEELDELYKSSADYEGIIRSKEEELAKLRSNMTSQAVEISESQIKLRDIQDKLNSVVSELHSTEKELASTKQKCIELEKEEKEARSLLQAKVSDDVKNYEGRKMLSRKIDELELRFEQQETSFGIEREKFVRDLTIKQTHLEKLTAEKDMLNIKMQELFAIKEEKERLVIELEKAKLQVNQGTSLKKEVSELKLKLEECELAKSQGLEFIKDLKAKLSDNINKSNKYKSDLELASSEKIQLVKQVSQLKKFIDDDLASKEYLILEKNKIEQDLENTRQELSSVNFEFNKMTKELAKKGDHLKRMRTSFTDDAATQRTKLNKEKEEFEKNEKKLRKELENFTIKNATLQKQKDKLSQEIDDLKHDISTERKANSSIERQKVSLQEKLDLIKSKYDQERTEKSQSEVEKRKLNSEVQTLKKELSDKASQLSVLQKVAKPSHSRNQSWDSASKPGTTDLAKKLEETERRLRRSEDARELLERQLKEKSPRHELRPVSSRMSVFEDSKHSPSGPPSPNRTSLRAINGIKSTIDSLYGNNSEENKPVRRHFRSKSSLDLDKENNDHLSVIDSVKSLNIRNKSVEEIEGLLTNYESSKRDLMSIFQDTSKKLLATKDSLAAAENEINRLNKELDQGRPRPLIPDSDSDTLIGTVSDLESRLDAEISLNQDLAESLNLYKARAEDYYSKLESAETVVLTATRAEAYAKEEWKEAKASLAAALKENKEQESKVIRLQSNIQLLEDKLEDSTIDYSHAREANKRLTREINDLKDRRKQDSTDMENSLNTMRERYKEEIKSMSEELEREKLRMGDIQTENRHLQHELDMLKVRNNVDTLDPSWGSFKVQLEDKIQELTKANEQAVLSHQDSQRRVGSLLSQVRTLRTTMEEITANRDQLQEEKRILERRLSEVSEQLEELVQAPGVQSSFGTEDELHQLKSSVRQKTLESNTAMERLRALEDEKLDIQKHLHLERTRMEELLNERSSLDRENKNLHLKVVDLEAQLLGLKSSDTQFLVQKVSRLEKQLEEQADRYAEESRNLRSNDRSVKDLQTQIQQKEKITAKLQEEVTKYESKIRSLQETVENLQGLETTYRLSSRRAEREARDYKETSLRLEKELDEWKNRYHSSKRNSRVFA